MTRRWARIVGCLALGLVITIGLSWLGAAALDQPGSATSGGLWTTRKGSKGIGSPRDVQERLTGLEVIEGASKDVVTARDGLVRRDRYYFLVGERAPPPPPSTTEPTTGEFVGGFHDAFLTPTPVDIYRSGWPLAALEWTDVPELNAALTAGPGLIDDAWEFGIAYAPGRGPGTLHDCDGWRRLPIRPSRGGLGLIVNTIVWSIFAGTALSLPGIVRTQVRRSRGLCVACGYPVRDNAGGTLANCPECGAATSVPAMPASGSPA